MELNLERATFMNQAYQVKLDTFEGPLDLLLHLINQYEIDIYDIPVAQITEQYMNYIHTMQHLEPKYRKRIFSNGSNASSN